jgi:thiamine-monophosphate kinase
MDPSVILSAVPALPPGRLLVVTVDALVDGVHFPEDTAPEDLAWKSLAVNLSDLAAMGAEPLAAQAQCAAPAGDSAWREQVLRGMREHAAGLGMALATGAAGGTRRRVAVQALGHLPRGAQLTRGGARAGDQLWVSGTLGDAGGALSLRAHAEPHAVDAADRRALGARLARPQPRLALGRALRGLASAAIDVSDGVTGDAAHLARRSGVHVRIREHAAPVSGSLVRVFGEARARALALSAGDDYELLFTAPSRQRDAVIAAARTAAVPVSPIGEILAGEGVSVVDEGGRAVDVAAGYEHFAPGGGRAP